MRDHSLRGARRMKSILNEMAGMVAFVRIVEIGSFSAAAKNLGVDALGYVQKRLAVGTAAGRKTVSPINAYTEPYARRGCLLRGVDLWAKALRRRFDHWTVEGTRASGPRSLRVLRSGRRPHRGGVTSDCARAADWWPGVSIGACVVSPQRSYSYAEGTGRQTITAASAEITSAGLAANQFQPGRSL